MIVIYFLYLYTLFQFLIKMKITRKLDTQFTDDFVI